MFGGIFIKFKGFLFLTFILLICIGSVSASDALSDNSMDVQSLIDYDDVSIETEDDSLSDSDLGSAVSLDDSFSDLNNSNIDSNLDNIDKSSKSSLKDSEGKSSNANLTIVPSQSSYKYGSDVRLNIRLFDEETPLSGLVLVTVNNVEHSVDVNNGTAFLIISGLENNTYPVLAKFVGNDFYEAVENNDATIVVNKSRVVTGNASVTEIVSYGDDVVITIENLKDVDGKAISLYGGYQVVGPKHPYGSFYLKKGKGSFYVPLLPVGNYSIYVVFGNNIGGSYELPTYILNFTVVKAKAEFSISHEDLSWGEDALINFNLKDKAGYGVEITDINNTLPVVEVEYGNFSQNITLDMGEGSFTLPNLSQGTHNFTLKFAETDFYEETIANFSVEVGKQEIIESHSVVLDKVIKSYDAKSRDSIIFILKDKLGNSMANMKFTVLYDGKKYVRTTDSTGHFNLSLSLKNDVSNELTISFAGDDKYNSFSKAISVNIARKSLDLIVSNKAYKAKASKKVLTATFKLNNGKGIVGKIVRFTINGKTYTAKTNSRGVASVNVNLSRKGTYNFKAEFLGDKTYAPIKKTAKLVIK